MPDARPPIPLRKDTQHALFQVQTRAPATHPAFRTSCPKALVSRGVGPRRWRCTDERGRDSHPLEHERARQFMSELAPRGETHATSTRLEHPALKRLAAEGMISVESNPQHFNYEHRVTITPHGRKVHAQFVGEEDRRDSEAQASMRSLFKSRVRMLIKARAGLVLVASKSNPQIKRWQRTDGGQLRPQAPAAPALPAAHTPAAAPAKPAFNPHGTVVSSKTGQAQAATGARVPGFNDRAPRDLQANPFVQAAAAPKPMQPTPGEPERLPDKVQQPHSDPTELFAAAQQAHEHQIQALDDGGGVEKALGATAVRLDQLQPHEFAAAVKAAMDKPGPVVVIGPPKDMARSGEKVRDDYKGDWTHLKDAVRASVAVDHPDDIPKAIAALKAQGITPAQRPKDRFANPTPAGYRDLLWNVRYPNGHIGEIQVHVKAMLAAKEGEGHKLLEQQRPIEAAAHERLKASGGNVDIAAAMTPDEHQRHSDLSARMKKLYDGAWSAAHGVRMRKAVPESDVKFFRVEHFPVYQKPGSLPVVIRPSGAELLPLEHFHHEAEPIDRAEYERLRRALVADADADTAKKAAAAGPQQQPGQPGQGPQGGGKPPGQGPQQ